MTSTIKKLYQLFPFKRPFCHLLRRVWKPPKRIYRNLDFTGAFRVKIDAAHSFRMGHYGYEIENGLFWAGLAGCWEKVSTGLWARLCRQADVIVDVGANTGVYALIAASLRPDAKVYAFEPVQRVFEKLDANAQLNGFSIQCVRAALSDHNGTATIYDPGGRHVYSVAVNKNTYDPSWDVSAVEIPVLRLDDFIEEHQVPKIDLMKIDVETHEPEVLRGFGRYLREHSPTLLIEIMTKEAAAGIEEQISGMGYSYFNIDERAGLRKVDHLSKSDYFNFLLCTEERAKGLGL